MIMSLQINKEGKLPKQAIKRMQQYFQFEAGKKITIMFERYKDKKTMNQLSYYFAEIVKALSEHTGYTLEECHSILKVKAGFITYQKIGNEEMPCIRSASDFNKAEMSDLIKSAISFCESLGIRIQTPEEYFEQT